MTSAVEFATAKGFRSVEAIPRVTGGEVASTLRRIRGDGMTTPVVLGAVGAGWPARALWDEAYLLSRCGGVQVKPSIGLPDHGVPYVVAADQVRRTMTLAEFWAEVNDQGRCYIDQHPLTLFEGLRDDVPIEELLGESKYTALNLWIGRGTKSGLHFDSTDNFVVMLRGTKLAVLADARETKRLYPFFDVTTKSQLDVEAPDFSRFPRAADVQLRLAELSPGDALFIPEGWWHYLSSSMDEYSISLNCWFGKSRATVARRLARTLALGPRYSGRLVYDFFVHGVAERPHFQRNYAGPPEGVLLYWFLRQQLARAGIGHFVVPGQRPAS